MISIQFVGQTKIVNRLNLWLDINLVPNILFRGPAGCGKTVLALDFAKNTKMQMHYQSLTGKEHDLFMPENCILILDEFHNLKEEESFYQVKGGLIGCTTEGATISEPLRTRMVELWFEPYSLQELAQIVRVHYPKLFPISCIFIAERSRECPRIAVNLGKELSAVFLNRHYVQTSERIATLLDSFGYSEQGFTDLDKRYIEFIRSYGTSASLRTISNVLQIQEDVIRKDVEPFLLKKGIVKISSRGRTYVETNSLML